MSPTARQARDDRRYLLARAEYHAACVKIGAPCHLCGQPIDYSVPSGGARGGAEAFELDHFYPVSTHVHLAADPANFRPSHARCNVARRNSPVVPTLGLPSEEW